MLEKTKLFQIIRWNFLGRSETMIISVFFWVNKAVLNDISNDTNNTIFLSPIVLVKCRGRLVQRETVRLLIQRSELDSHLRRNRWMFLSRRGNKNMRDPDSFELLFSKKQQIIKRHLLEKSGLQVSLYEKERTYKLVL